MIFLATIIGDVTVLDRIVSDELTIDHGRVIAVGDWLPFFVLWTFVIIVIRILYKRKLV